MDYYEHGGKNVRYDFSISLNPDGLDERLAEELKDITGYIPYPDTENRKLREAIAQRENADWRNIVLGNGASDIIFRLFSTIRPKETLLLKPTFSEYERCARISGSHISFYNLDMNDDFAVREDILDRLEGVDMFLLCNPNNPTGRLIDDDLLSRIIEKCRENRTTFVIDECFLSFTKGRSRKDDASVIRSFTKDYSLAGIRLGYLVCRDMNLVSRLEMNCPQWNISSIAERFGLCALKLENIRYDFTDEMNYVMDSFESMGIRCFPTDCNYMLFYIEKDLNTLLAPYSIAVRDCSNFFHQDGWYRIGLKGRRENDMLICALGEVLNG